MSLFQILMLAATLFFAYQIYRHVHELDSAAPSGGNRSEPVPTPPSASALVDEADAAYEAGEVEKAKRLLEEAYALEGGNVETINKLAFVTAKSGDVHRAIRLYERSLEIDGSDDLTHNAIASLYRGEGVYERSEEHYRKALSIDPEYAQTHYNYANLLVDMNRTDEARTHYERALELRRDFPQAREALAELERQS
ncbi:MAG: tetratricopeptide repeat protein [Sulfuricurvum sp.]|nr:tetratricopeptide repeat protein [Sulfuricurvum sp.]